MGLERRTTMNRQELFDGNIVNNQIGLDTTYLPFIKSVRGSFSDVTFPRFFSGWPYFVLILAALIMGSSSNVSSKGLESHELTKPLESTIARNQSLIHHKAQSYIGKTAEYQGFNGCEAKSAELTSVRSPLPQKFSCSNEVH